MNSIAIEDALKIWLGKKFTNRDMMFYNFMKKNNNPNLFWEYKKECGGGAYGNKNVINFKNDTIDKNYVNKYLYHNKNAKNVKKIVIVDENGEGGLINIDEDENDDNKDIIFGYSNGEDVSIMINSSPEEDDITLCVWL